MITITIYTLLYKPYSLDVSLPNLQIIKIVYFFLTILYIPLINIRFWTAYNHSGSYKIESKGRMILWIAVYF
jgi:hypothetical protein